MIRYKCGVKLKVVLKVVNKLSLSSYKSMKKRKKVKKRFDWHKFFKLFFIRLANRILELGTLFLIGYLLGLKLIRY